MELNFSYSLMIRRPADQIYDMVSDVTRMGEWSPVCRSCWWDEGNGPRVGSWFTGRNETPERTWETRSLVVVADPGREFTFVVGGSRTLWGFTFTPVDGGTQVTERWEVLPDGVASFHERFADQADSELALRVDAARHGIPATLAAIKDAAEASEP